MTIHKLSVFLTLIAALLTRGTSAAEPEIPQNQQGFWNADKRREAAFAAVRMIAVANPYTIAVTRIEIQNGHKHIWHEPVYDVALGAPELNAGRLVLIKDRTAMPDFRGRDPQMRNKIEQATYDLYCQALYYASFVPVEAFARSAEANAAVTFGHLYKEANRPPDDKVEQVNRYRGKVIPIQGQLLRLRKHDAPVPLLDRGIRHVYEGWIKGPTKNAPPFWVVLACAPEDADSPTGLLEPAEDMNRPVKFYGYFIKVLPYPAQVGSGGEFKTVDMFTPMLIGPTVIVTGKAANPTSPEETSPAPFTSLLMIIVASFGGFAILILVGLTWWFRKDDHHFRERLRQYHADRALELLSDEAVEGMKHEDSVPQTNPGPKVTDEAGPTVSQ